MKKQNSNPPPYLNLKKLEKLLKTNEEWLMERILKYAKNQGYAAYTSTLKEAWRLSITGLSGSVITGISNYSRAPELAPEEDLSDDPVAMFGIVEAKKHRMRGISLRMFLGLMKYYRQSYIDLIKENELALSLQENYELFVNRIFDRIEIGFCVEWSGSSGDKALKEMQVSNRLMTNEKNKYLTIFESIPNPVIILDHQHKIDNMNFSAVRLFKGNFSPGSQYYFISGEKHQNDNQNTEQIYTLENPNVYDGFSLSELPPWLKKEVDRFYQKDSETMEFEKRICLNNKSFIFRVKFSKNLDISDKFMGTIIIIEDITSLKNAMDEVKTLRGFIPICAHCKNIRDDKGFWLQIEEYIRDRSDAEFSHSICPDCVEKYYSDINKARGTR